MRDRPNKRATVPPSRPDPEHLDAGRAEPDPGSRLVPSLRTDTMKRAMKR